MNIVTAIHFVGGDWDSDRLNYQIRLWGKNPNAILLKKAWISQPLWWGNYTKTHRKTKIRNTNFNILSNFVYCFSVLLGFYPPRGIPSGWSFPQAPPCFLVLLGFYPPREFPSVWSFPQPPTCFSVLLGFYPHRGTPSDWSFPPPPTLRFGSSGVLPTPRTPSGWSFPQPPTCSSVLLGIYPPRGTLPVGRFPDPTPSFRFF